MDFALIALAEFFRVIFFLSVRGPQYFENVIAYIADNANVATWVEYRRPKNRVALYFNRLLYRLGGDRIFVAFLVTFRR